MSTFAVAAVKDWMLSYIIGLLLACNLIQHVPYHFIQHRITTQCLLFELKNYIHFFSYFFSCGKAKMEQGVSLLKWIGDDKLKE